jgi:hypothetical protein
MRKNQLLIASALAALIAGSGIAVGQSGGSSGPGAPGGAGMNAPAEKIAPSSSQKGSSGAAQINEPSGERSERRGSETTGQAPSGRSGPSSQSGQSGSSTQNSPSGTMQNNLDSTKSGQANERNSGQTGERAGTSTNTNVSVNLSTEQRTRIHEVIVKDRSAPRVTNVNFSLSVGTPVPRTVKLVRLPATVIEIQPAWRGFEYFLVGDQIVVVDPNNLEIVAVINV